MWLESVQQDYWISSRTKFERPPHAQEQIWSWKGSPHSKKTLNTLYRPVDLLGTAASTNPISTITCGEIDPSTCKMDIVLLQLHTSYHVSSYCITKCINSGSQIRQNPCARALEILQSMRGKFTTLIWMIRHYIDSLVNQNNHQNASRTTNPYWQKYHEGT